MGWYVLRVSSKSEKRVAQVCDYHGLPHYLPLREYRRIYQRRKVAVLKPLFPGYVFADLTEESRGIVLRTNHVLRMILPSDQEQLVRELEQIQKALQVDPQLSADSGLHTGVRVRIVAGAFRGVEGIIEKLCKGASVWLNVEMVGQSVPVAISPDYLEVIDS
jgi:transcription antitermination factor NusG